MTPIDQELAMPGLAFLHETQSRRSAPAAFERRLGFVLTQVAHGQVRIEATPDDDCVNPMQTVHGGYLATLLDAAMGAAVHSLLDAEQSFTTVEMKVSFMKAGLPASPLAATANVVRAGRRIVFVEGQAHAPGGDLLASASATCLVREAQMVRANTD